MENLAAHSESLSGTVEDLVQENISLKEHVTHLEAVILDHGGIVPAFIPPVPKSRGPSNMGKGAFC